MTNSLPVLTLTILGAVFAVIGIFAAGNIVLAMVGLGAIFGAGLLGLGEMLLNRRSPASSTNTSVRA